MGSDYSGPGGFRSPANDAQWRSVLASATQIDIAFDVQFGIGDSYALDNFSVTEPPVVPQVPVVPASPPAKKPKCKKQKKKKKRCKKKR